MDPNTAVLLSALISAVVAAVVSIAVTAVSIRNSRVSVLIERVAELNRLAIEFPYFEDDRFCRNLPSSHAKYDEKYLRYENYCCLVFNLLEAIWLHYRGNERAMARVVYPRELILRHKGWWSAPCEKADNALGYATAFAAYVNRVVKSKL